MCYFDRSLGTAGQLGDAASRGRSPRGDRGLLDNHPAATLALRRAAAQRAAPDLAPGAGVPGLRLPAETIGALGVVMRGEHILALQGWRLLWGWDTLLEPEDP